MILLLVGCGLSGPKPLDTADTADTGPPTGEPYACVETGRAPIADTSVVADGMTFAPADVVAAFTGGFAGRFTFTSGDGQFAGFGVRPDGAWELVTREIRGSDLGEGAPIEECVPLYAFGTEAALNDASGAFDEVFPAALIAPAVDAVSLTAMVPLDAVVGTTRPSWDPSEWTYNALSVSASGAPGEWTVSVLWQSASGTDAKAEADTGTVEPSGMVEAVGTGTFTPAEE